MDRRDWCRAAACGMVACALPRAFAADDAGRTREIEQVLEAWRTAWELGEWSAYAHFYDPEFHGHAPSRKAWEQERRERLARKDITVKIEQLQVELEDAYRADVHFVQRYTAAGHTDVGRKRLRLLRTEGGWRITQEDWKPRGGESRLRT